ncbi:MAG TPA: dual specificity protein phosphatase 23 [Nitrososphaeraceae archaeon]|nr:dual specificity protein phosphatase 23 [Nitrososphaeraceae archaeon]
MTKIGNAYRWIYGRMVNRPTNFSWVIKDKLAGSGMPMNYSQFLWVMAHGVKAIVTVREVPLPSKWFSNGNGDDIDYFHLRVEDYGAPSLEEIDNTIDYIQQQISNKKPVMVHCAAGRGRTGTILAAYLIKKENLTANQAIKKIRSMRPGSIQSDRQEMALYVYEQYLNSKTKN